MKIQGVNPSFVDEMRNLGYDSLTTRELVKIHIHNVDIEFIKSLISKGIEDLSVRRLVKFKIHGAFD